MPQPTKAQAYSDLLFVAENLLAASIALADDLDDLDAGDWADEDFDADCLPNDVSGVLDLTSLNWMEIAEYLMGGCSRGPYNKIPKLHLTRAHGRVEARTKYKQVQKMCLVKYFKRGWWTVVEETRFKRRSVLDLRFFHRRGKNNSSHFDAYCLGCINACRPATEPIDIDAKPAVVLGRDWFSAGE
ncbi:hypothetical protein FB451DRAFT_1194632 [Mycena latifolia]|nr:hypothetical protein FB451DRAFT_1194632 [Mycena latifolia]